MGSSDNKDKDDDFGTSGPTHMITQSSSIEIDWDSEDHRRIILACLVRGVYVRQRDRTNERDPPLAPAWWESFHFREHKMLSCDYKCLFCELLEANRCGAMVFEYAPPEGAAHRHPSSAPLYVVAFRGTITKPWDLSAIHDIYLDGNVLLNQQHRCHDFLQARKQVGDLLETIAGGGNGGSATGTSGAVWLAGHSLGTSIALDVGRDMASRKGGCYYLPTFLFNPPQISPAPAIGMLPMAPVAKRDLFTSSYLVKHLLGNTVMRPHKERMESLFKQLSPWVPNLYVNPRDVICSGFVDYFEQRELTKEWSAGVAASAAMLSYRDMGYSVLGKQNDQPSGGAYSKTMAPHRLASSSWQDRHSQSRLSIFLCRRKWKLSHHAGASGGFRLLVRSPCIT